MTTVDDLIDQLLSLQEDGYGAQEVKIVYQPSYPVMTHLRQVVSEEEYTVALIQRDTEEEIEHVEGGKEEEAMKYEGDSELVATLKRLRAMEFERGDCVYILAGDGGGYAPSHIYDSTGW